jgi:hypothetical protein
VRRDEGAVEHLAAAAVLLLQDRLADALKERDVAADPDREELARQRAAAGQEVERLLRVGEPDQARLLERVDADDRAAARRRLP